VILFLGKRHPSFSVPGRANNIKSVVEMIERVAEEHRSHDEWEMVEFTHTLPE
jgi:hypothetical protein